MFELQSVSKSFKNSAGSSVEILSDLSLKVIGGEIFGLIGLSGAGKSTALRLFNGLEEPCSGHILWKGQDISDCSASELRQVRQKIGMIFQHFNLISNKTVGQNVSLPLQIAGWHSQDIQQRVKECLDLVKLEDKVDAYPNQLSGGQKQRVAIARSIANRPSLLLADEPTSALDPITKFEVLNCLEEINKKFGLTIIIATHEMNIVRSLCHRVALLDNGKVLEILPVNQGQIAPASSIGKRLMEIA